MTCAMDAGAGDAGRDAGRDAGGDARSDSGADAREDARDAGGDGEDAAVEDDAEFDDVIVDDDADVAPDRVDVSAGCGCRSTPTRTSAQPWALAALAGAVTLRRRAQRRR
jgi:MYXO-CTERM domain-containing protein